MVKHQMSIGTLGQARTLTVVMRQSEFHHLKETTHHWLRNLYLMFVFWPPEYFIVSKRTQLNALKSNSTINFYRFENYRRPEGVRTPWVTYSEQGRRWDCSWDKKNYLFYLLRMKYSVVGGKSSLTFPSCLLKVPIYPVGTVCWQQPGCVVSWTALLLPARPVSQE